MSIYDRTYCSNVRGLTGKRTKPYIDKWEFSYELTTAPTADPVTLEEAKHFARIDGTGDTSFDALDDALVTQLIKSATKVFEGQTGRSLISQTWTAWLDCMPCSSVLHLSKGRIDSVTSVTAYDEGGTTEVLDSSYYEIDKENARIGLTGSEAWPVGDRGFKTFAVEYVAGYGDAEDVPDAIKTVINQMVSHWYEHRETATDLTFNTLPMATQLLINTLKIAGV